MLAQRVATSDPVFCLCKGTQNIVYIMNAIEDLHMQLCKMLKNWGHFPSDEEATKLIFLALRDIARKWKEAADQLEISGHPIGYPIWRALFCGRTLKAMQCLHIANELGI
jgi:hypothetical protein